MLTREKSLQQHIDPSRSAQIKNREVRRVPRQLQVRPVYQMNGMLLLIIISMIAYGLVMLFSASMSDGYANYEGNSMYYVLRQASITGFGLILALIISIFFKIDFFDKFLFAILLYALTTLLLVYVKFAGEIWNSARRWIRIGPLTLQPSELAKVASVFCLAGYFSWSRRRRQNSRKKSRNAFTGWLAAGWIDILIPALSMVVWLVLVLWQPHLSGFIILSFVILMSFLSAGIPVRSWLSGITQAVAIILVVSLLLAAALPMYLKSQDMSMKDFQESVTSNFAHVERRMDMFLNPEEADSDDTYQINQAIIAIGSGGLTGVGLGKGRQKYNYLPEAHNDYIYAIIGEELGFIGTLSVLLLFILFMIVGTGVSLRAKNNYSAMIAAGYTGLISIQAMLNMGVATRLLPATGISLPFFSYGGTSNLFFLTAIGFLLAVSRTGQIRKNSLGSIAHVQDEQAVRGLDTAGSNQGRKPLRRDLEQLDKSRNKHRRYDR